MKLSQKTLSILKNFSVINRAIIIKPGNILKTIEGVGKTVVAIATVEEIFDKEIAIHDLLNFIAALTLIKGDIDVTFTKEIASIVSNSQTINYTLSEASLLKSVTAPDKLPNFPKVKASFGLPANEIATVLKAVGLLGMDRATFNAKGDEVSITGIDKNGGTRNVYENRLPLENKGDVSVTIKREHLMMIASDDYSVGLHDAFVAFTGKDDVKYWVGAASD